MRSGQAFSLLAMLLAAGCGQLKLPKPTPAPKLARLKERCPRFTVLSREWIEAGPSDFAGKPLVVVGVNHRYLRDLGPWVDLLRPRIDGAAWLFVVEEADPRMFPSLAGSLPSGIDVHFDPSNKWDRLYAESFRLRRRADDARLDSPEKADRIEAKADRLKAAADAKEPGLRRALGLVGEGPHVAVIGPRGTLLALVDGPLSDKRGLDVTEALDAARAATGATSE